MTYALEINEELDRKFSKLAKRYPKRLRIIDKKVKEILVDPYRFKALTGEKKGVRRVHIDRHFVLTYEISENVVRLLDFDHHDKVYD